MATKLVVSDLPPATNELQIRLLFEKFGPVSNIDYSPQKTPTRASIEMYDADAAQRAITGLNNRPFMEQKIHVTQALLSSR